MNVKLTDKAVGSMNIYIYIYFILNMSEKKNRSHGAECTLRKYADDTKLRERLKHQMVVRPPRVTLKQSHAIQQRIEKSYTVPCS